MPDVPGGQQQTNEDGEVIFYYNQAENPNGDYIPGLPLADFTVSDFDNLPEFLQDTLAAMSQTMYQDIPVSEPE